MKTAEKEKTYQEIKYKLRDFLSGESSLIARMATGVSLYHRAFETVTWTGFYLKDPKKNELVIGPYQGKIACLRIPFGKGVCGEVARTQKSLIVPDVQLCENHIQCDPDTRSEIVVPVIGSDNRFLGVFDTDSDRVGAFDKQDEANIKQIIKIIINL